MAKGIATHPLFHVPTARASLVNTGQEWCWIWRDGEARNRLYLFAHRACDRGRPSAHKFRTQRAAASTRGIWHCRRSLYASCGLKLSGRCIPHFGKRRRLTIRPITTAATRRREFAYPDDKPEPNRLWRPRVKVKDCRQLLPYRITEGFPVIRLESWNNLQKRTSGPRRPRLSYGPAPSSSNRALLRLLFSFVLIVASRPHHVL